MTALYLTEPGTKVHYKNQTFTIKKNQTYTCRLSELELLVILPGVQLTDVVISALLDQGIEAIFLRQDGQFRGRLQASFASNPLIRLAQYRTVETSFGLAFAQKFAYGKIRNQRALLQIKNRATKGKIAQLSESIDTINVYQLQLKNIDKPRTRDELMGIEGISARSYYQALQHFFPPHWQFNGRNRRPPKDPINALLSWGYGVLLARIFAVCVKAGLDPYLGFFHSIQPYRPNLVLDLMEEFRPILVDYAVISLIQSQMLDIADFQPSSDGQGIWLGVTAKKLLLRELEERMNQYLLYPPQNRKLKLNQIFLEQARMLARCLLESSLDYEPFFIK
ncbi:CRISPR-associated endonuclease Cas1 [Cyanobacterium aponinum UTEX 3222]|uniref:CRISPR-associated endonuclease Cas1 n=1 Tax=Cyanobacterium aponinum TaxID=379064 RepID=UPI00308C3DF9|nr:CRISPR-associated endonuclease Cas1 [Cyanobacterium aponinum UTEX 3222]